MNTRLRQLREKGDIDDYRILDHKLIENYLVTAGFSELMIRYFPTSYKKVKPLHYITGQYEPLLCDNCGKDLLEEMFKKDYTGLMAEIHSRDESGKNFIKDVYVACKGDCDRVLQKRAREDGAITAWVDLSDLVIPVEFLRHLFAMMNRIRSGYDIYTDDAYKKEKDMLIALAQKVLQFTTKEERRRFDDLQQLPDYL